MVLDAKPTNDKKDRIPWLLEELELNHLSKCEKDQITKICIKYSDIFCLQDDTLTTTNIYNPVAKVKKDSQPIYSEPYRLPHVQKQEVEEQIHKMLQNKIIEKATSAWNSPILLVPKKKCSRQEEMDTSDRL